MPHKRFLTPEERRYIETHFPTMRTGEIARRLGVRKDTVSNHARRRGIVKERREMLCWECRRAGAVWARACSWDKDFTPVAGWVTREIVGRDIVVECPLFVREKR